MSTLTQAQRIAALDLIVPAADPLFVLDQVRSMFTMPENITLETGLLTIAGQIVTMGAGVGIEAFFGGEVALTETFIGSHAQMGEVHDADEAAASADAIRHLLAPRFEVEDDLMHQHVEDDEF